MKRSLIVTGGRGFVAGSVIAQAGASWDVHALSRGGSLAVGPGLRWHMVDPGIEGRLSELFGDVKPDAVIHLAAMANIDACESDRETAWAANVGFTGRLARLCAEHGSRLVYVSTDNVFDGAKGRYLEDDAAHPVNHYGRTKLEAEDVVTGAVANSVVARISLVMGLHVLGEGNSFLSRMIPVLAAGQELYVPNNEVRSPIDVITLGRALLELAGGGFTGRIHLAGNAVLNRHAMVSRIAEELGYSSAQVVPNDPTVIPGRADRPRDVSLDSTRARMTLETPMLGLEEGLALVLSESRKRGETHSAG